MNFSGIVLGLVAFLCIGFFHPLVIKGEFYFGTKCWWVFALAGVVMLVGSLLIENIYFSVILGVISFSPMLFVDLYMMMTQTVFYEILTGNLVVQERSPFEQMDSQEF